MYTVKTACVCVFSLLSGFFLSRFLNQGCAPVPTVRTGLKTSARPLRSSTASGRFRDSCTQAVLKDDRIKAHPSDIMTKYLN